MKKTIAILMLVAILAFSLASCFGSAKEMTFTEPTGWTKTESSAMSLYTSSTGSNFNYMKVKGAGGFNSMKEADYQKELDLLGATMTSFERITFAGMEKTIHVTYNLNMSGINMTGEQYMIKTGNYVYTLTFTTVSGDTGAKTVFDAIKASIEFK